MNDAQKYLLDNGCDDLILNDKKCTKVEDRLYSSDMMMEFAKSYHEKLSKLHQPKVIGTYAIVRWYDNNKEDVVCSTKEVAEDYVKKYNTLCGEEKCFVDTYVWLPLEKA